MNPIADFFNSAYRMTRDQMKLFEDAPNAKFQPKRSTKIKNKRKRKKK